MFIITSTDLVWVAIIPLTRHLGVILPRVLVMHSRAVLIYMIIFCALVMVITDVA